MTYAGKAVSGVRKVASGAKQKIVNVAERIATPFKALSGSVKNIFVSSAVAKKIAKAKENIKQFFCGTAQKVGDFFKGVGSKIADGAKAVGNFVKNINWKKVGDVAAIVGIGAAAVGAIVFTAGAATPVVAGIGYGIAAGTAAYTVADVQQTVTDGDSNYIRDTLFAGDQRAYDDSRVVVDIAGLGYTIGGAALSSGKSPKTGIDGKAGANLGTSSKKNVNSVKSAGSMKNKGITIKYGDEIGKMGTYVENPKIKIDWEQYSKHAIERMRQRRMTQKMIDSIVENGKVLSQNEGNKYVYVTKEGVAVVSKEGKLITGWSSSDYDEDMIKIVNRLFGD